MPNSKEVLPQGLQAAMVPVWDLPTRIFHWCLLVLVITSFVTAQAGGNVMAYHMCCGYMILVLLLFRLIWGLIGSETARFTSFLHGPATAWRYARGLMHATPPPHLGHNPLGGWSIAAMLAALLLQVITGLFANDDIATQGPLYPWVSDTAGQWLTRLHLFNQGLIITLVSLHVLAVLFYLLINRANLITPMITGRRTWPESIDPPNQAMQPTWLALVVAALCAVGVYWLVR